MLSVGIIGLPNVGKSTLFNALTAGQAQVSNYPFTTIDSNVAVVPVPDQRLVQLESLLEPQESTPCFIQFIDIAGLVEGASQGAGLGNQFLDNIRQVDALVHLLRCFHDGEVSHVLEGIAPQRDAEIVETELLVADLEVLQRAIEKKKRIWQTHPAQHAEERQRLLTYLEKLREGVPLRSLDLDTAAEKELKGLGLLTGKPVLYVLNVSEDGAEGDLDLEPFLHSPLLRTGSSRPQYERVSAKIEWELQQLSEEDRQEFMQDLGIRELGLRRVIRKAFELLGLITFYTIANQKLRAWELLEGSSAVQAAGKIHSNMQRGFIRASVASFEQLRGSAGFHELHRQGQLRTEGKDYRVRDGDVIEFVFHS